MIEITVEKNLIAFEDLLTGIGTVNQTRGGVTAPVTKINGSIFPYDADFTMAEKIDDLQAQIDSVPAVVDEFGEFLTGFLNESAVDLVGYTQRMWVKTIAADHNELYYGDVMMLEWDPTNGNLITTGLTDYIAADAVVTAAFEAADDAITAAFIAADVVVTDAFEAADTAIIADYEAADAALAIAYAAADDVLDAKIEHRVNTEQQTDILANANVTKTVTYTDGSWVKITVSSNFTLAFVFPAGEVCSMILEFVDGGSKVITWPAGIKFPGGNEPSLTAAGTDHVVVYQDGNNQLYATLSAKDVKV